MQGVHKLLIDTFGEKITDRIIIAISDFNDFRDYKKCFEDYRKLIGESKKEVRDIITSCRNFVYVNNPSLDDDYSEEEISLNIKKREESRKILLGALGIEDKIYKEVEKLKQELEVWAKLETNVDELINKLLTCSAELEEIIEGKMELLKSLFAERERKGLRELEEKIGEKNKEIKETSEKIKEIKVVLEKRYKTLAEKISTEKKRFKEVKGSFTDNLKVNFKNDLKTLIRVQKEIAMTNLDSTFFATKEKEKLIRKLKSFANKSELEKLCQKQTEITKLEMKLMNIEKVYSSIEIRQDLREQINIEKIPLSHKAEEKSREETQEQQHEAKIESYYQQSRK